MKLSKALQAFVNKASKSDPYWAEHAKLSFALDLEKQLRAAKMTYSALAKQIGTSAAYITKVFRGDSNMTIETMVKLAMATKGHLEIRIVESTSVIQQWDMANYPPSTGQVVQTTAPSATITYLADYAANQDKYGWGKAA